MTNKSSPAGEKALSVGENNANIAST